MRTVLCHGSDDAGVSAPPRARWREVADVLEELTTTWYFGER